MPNGLRRAVAVLACWSFGWPASSQQRKETPPINIDQLIYVYAPNSDSEGVFAKDNAAALLTRVAAERGFKVVLINADSLAPKPKNPWESLDSVMAEAIAEFKGSKEVLQTKLREHLRERNSIIVIATHGATSLTGDDTYLLFSGIFPVTYGDLAQVIDASPKARAVVLDSCHGFCDRLKKSATQSGGKLVAATSAKDHPSDDNTSRIIISALARLIASKDSIPLGTSFQKEVERFLSTCEAPGTPLFHDRDNDDDLEPAGRYKEHEARCRLSQKGALTVSSGTGSQPFTFGGGSKSIVDAFDHKVSLCKGIGFNAQSVYLPGVTYDALVLGPGSEAWVEEFIQGNRYDFTCRPDGTWAVRIHYDPLENLNPFDKYRNPGPGCNEPGARYLKLAQCAQHSDLEIKGVYGDPCKLMSTAYAQLRKLGVEFQGIDLEGGCLSNNHLYPVEAGRNASSQRDSTTQKH